MRAPSPKDLRYLRRALQLARRGYGQTSPNPMVGAVLVKNDRIIGQGWHHRAGAPHAEIEAIQQALEKKHATAGATLYVTLEPCCTHGRTPPCTQAILDHGITRVVAAASDPNPRHAGRGFALLRSAGVRVASGPLAEESARLNEAFNHWITQRTPLVTVKAAMTLDGKIADNTGRSQWITGEKARAYGMKLRQGADAILVGINTVLSDNPSLTFRSTGLRKVTKHPLLRRIILDRDARTPLASRVLRDQTNAPTTIVVGRGAPRRRQLALGRKVQVWTAPERRGHLDLSWVLKKLGAEEISSLLVEGGGEVNASFLLGGLAHRVEFFYAPKILGGQDSIRTVGGEGARSLDETIALAEVRWRRLGPDLLLTARVLPGSTSRPALS